jgi:flagellar basal-body rod protein FlgC
MIPAVSDIISFGLSYEKSRAEAASYNLAMANVALSQGQHIPQKIVWVDHTFEQQLQDAVRIDSNPHAQTRHSYEPNHPLANSQGLVSYPKVDSAIEMATLLSANRAYEANIRAYNSLREMNTKALEIGK